MREDRPDPDALLKQAQALERDAQRGRLKVYLGMAAGAGKTYTMLSDAATEKERGIDVVIGYLEHHGRVETERLGTGFEQVPLRELDYRGVRLREVDVELILKRKPRIVLIDELAHSNAPDSRHAKRWQDVEEILDCGINVFTTMNIQHVESLRDVVAQITGIEVQETVPDLFLAKADEVELVDVTPEELLQRLEAGKIYAPEKIDTARKNFFQKGNLVALREIVLRRTADTVDVQLRSLRRAQGIDAVWPATPRVLVAVGPTKFAMKLVRAAARLAHNLRAELVAVNVSTSRELSLSAEGRNLATRALSLAETLGAETVQTAADDIVSELIRVARDKNANVIVIGKPIRVRLRDFIVGSPVDELIRKSGDIDVYVVRAEKEEATAFTPERKPTGTTPISLLSTLLILVLTTGLALTMFPYFDASNVIMVYLLGTAWVATHYGRIEAAIAAIGSVLIFDFCFVPPRWTFAVSDGQYIVTFMVMLIISLLISTLTIRRREQSQIVVEREQRTSSLYELTRHLAVARTIEEVAAAAIRHISLLLKSQPLLLVVDELGQLKVVGSGSLPNAMESAVASWVSQHEVPAGRGTDTLQGSAGTYFPLPSEKLPHPVLGVFPSKEQLDRDQLGLLGAISHLLGSSIDRINRESEAQVSRVRAEREEMRNLLLSSVSHDLRTPLAAIAGSASVVLTDDALSSTSRNLVTDISNEASRLGLIVRNILDLTRLESGEIKLHREWQSVEELIGAALERTAALLGSRSITVELPADLPLIEVDGLLMEQLLINLLENAARHTPESAGVSVKAYAEPNSIIIEVSDNGPGFRDGQETRVFDRLYTGNKRGGGIGLGLTICRAVVEAHGGSIAAMNRTEGGARFVVSLPRSQSQPQVAHG